MCDVILYAGKEREKEENFSERADQLISREGMVKARRKTREKGRNEEGIKERERSGTGETRKWGRTGKGGEKKEKRRERGRDERINRLFTFCLLFYLYICLLTEGGREGREGGTRE